MYIYPSPAHAAAHFSPLHSSICLIVFCCLLSRVHNTTHRSHPTRLASLLTHFGSYIHTTQRRGSPSSFFFTTPPNDPPNTKPPPPPPHSALRCNAQSHPVPPSPALSRPRRQNGSPSSPPPATTPHTTSRRPRQANPATHHPRHRRSCLPHLHESLPHTATSGCPRDANTRHCRLGVPARKMQPHA